MPRRSPIVLALLAAAACAGPRASSSGRPPPETVLARVNGDPITIPEMRSEFGQSHEGHTKFLVAGESEAREFLRKLVDKHLLLQEARRMGLDRRDDVRAELAELETAEMAKHLLALEVEAPAKATDADVQAVYDGMTELADVRELRCDTRADAERALERIRAGEEFDAVARDVSTAPTRVYGGMVKGAGWGAKAPEWEETVARTKTGEMSEIFETRQGFEFVHVDERRPATKAPFAQVAPRIRSTLETRRKAVRDRAFQEALFAKYRVELAAPVPAEMLVRIAGAEAGKPEADGERVVASWQGGKLSAADLAALVNAKALARAPADRYQRTYRDLATSAAYGRLVRQEAAARGYARAAPVAAKVDARRDKLAVDLLLGEYVIKGISVTEEDARKLYDSRPEAFAAQEEREVAHIEVETLDEAREVKALLASGKPFEEVAKERSKNAKTKEIGGSLGFVTRSDCPPGFEQVFSVAEGETTEPVAGKGGWHVVKVRTVVPARPRPWEAVKEEALASLKRRRLDDALAAWTTRLRAVSKIETYEGALTEFVRASAKDAEALAGGAAKPLPSDHGMGTLGGGHGAAPGGGASPHGGGAPAGSPSPHGGGAPGASPHGAPVPGSAGTP